MGNLFLVRMYVLSFIVCIGYGVSFPLFGILLEQTGASGTLIGLTGTMPAIAWVLATPFLPKLQHRFNIHFLMGIFLCIALVGLCAMYFVRDYYYWIVFRFVFGGAIGLFFRLVEFEVNFRSEKGKTAGSVGIYSACFMAGLIVGSLLLSYNELSGSLPFILVAAPILFCIVLLSLYKAPAPLKQDIHENPHLNKALVLSFLAAPVAMLALFSYGLYENLPAYLLSVYAMKAGLGEANAALTLTASALGSLLLSVPIGLLANRFGILPILLATSFAAFLLCVVIPDITDNTNVFFLALLVLAGAASSLYNLGFALLGEQFSGAALAVANAAAGSIYSIASIIGPFANGYAMENINPPFGVMYSVAFVFALAFAGTIIFSNQARKSEAS